MKNLLVILSTILLGLASCDTTDEQDLSAIQPEIISKGNLYGNGGEGITQQNLSITDQETWMAIMNQMDAVNNVSDDFTQTEINFSDYQLVAIFDDIKSNGGSSLEINLLENDDNIEIGVVHINAEGNVPTVITQPYLIARIPSSDKTIIFKP